jgi:hypothetical protein
MTRQEALDTAQARGWSASAWLGWLASGSPEVEHPFDYLTEDEVESILPGESVLDIAARMSRGY